MAKLNAFQVHQKACQALDSFAQYIEPGIKLTLVARMPGDTDCEFVLTEDDLVEVLAPIERRRIEKPTFGLGAAPRDCPGHVASASDPKVCGYCGIHIDSLRPDGEI